jgi:hypothetical protein
VFVTEQTLSVGKVYAALNEKLCAEKSLLRKISPAMILESIWEKTSKAKDNSEHIRGQN